MALAIGGLLLAAPAEARPPTLQVSPGYQARLVESRKAYADAWYAAQGPQAPAVAAPVARRKKSRPR
jgi:hypothetical protein